MRIYRERIPQIARDVVRALMASEQIDVEASMVEEVELDVASVLNEYRRVDWEISERARDLVALRGLDYSHTHKIRSRLAREKKFGMGDEAIDWLCQQMLEILLQSSNVDEIWGEDNDLRRLISPILKKELGVGNDLDREVKRRIKNLEEGTSDYEVEYQKTLDKVRANKNMVD